VVDGRSSLRSPTPTGTKPSRPPRSAQLRLALLPPTPRVLPLHSLASYK